MWVMSKLVSSTDVSVPAAICACRSATVASLNFVGPMSSAAAKGDSSRVAKRRVRIAAVVMFVPPGWIFHFGIPGSGDSTRDSPARAGPVCRGGAPSQSGKHPCCPSSESPEWCAEEGWEQPWCLHNPPEDQEDAVERAEVAWRLASAALVLNAFSPI